jgi:hypothetical protein
MLNTTTVAADVAGANAALNAERHRAGEILFLSSKYGLPSGFATRHIEQGTSLDAARGLIINYAAATSEASAISSRSPVFGAGAGSSWAQVFARIGVKT